MRAARGRLTKAIGGVKGLPRERGWLLTLTSRRPALAVVGYGLLPTLVQCVAGSAMIGAFFRLNSSRSRTGRPVRWRAP